MTTATAEVCGHRWARRARCAYAGTIGGHRCGEPADHPAPCRCRCGATTTRERT